MATTESIPAWISPGILPAYDRDDPTSNNRSPYKVSLTDLVLRFGTSTERRTILAGFLEFRSRLHAIGLINGFQWIDGSFLENIENIDDRPPRDMDVVTFFYTPDGETQETLAEAHPHLFVPHQTKQDHHVDAYFVELNGEELEPLLSLSTYWYSIWSHRRDERWKGFLQIDLSQDDDQIARANLDNLFDQGGQR